MRTYLIHDNHGRPFRVDINRGKQTNYVCIYNNETDAVIGEYTPEEIFIGQSPLNAMTEFSGGHGSDFDGNSILLRVSGLRYIYIGCEIYEFNARAPITKYVSPVGNNDVPYPHAQDISGNIYLMLENVVMTMYKMIQNEYNDVYDYWYRARLMTSNEHSKNARKPIYGRCGISFTTVHSWTLGNEKYSLSYVANPAHEYDRLVTIFGPMAISRDGETKSMSKQDYIDIIGEFGTKMGFAAMDSVTIHERIW